MPKKIRFPLKLADNAQVRTLEELREHFDLESILGYYKNGKLLTWLEDRYLEGEAEAIRALDETASGFQRRLCKVFQVEYTGNDADMEAVQLRQERLAKLRTITDEPEFIEHIDQVAFNQEELADLLDEDETTIYLCGESFTIPASRKGITYIGIENPRVHISGKVPETEEDFGITFVNVACDNLPQPKTYGKSGGSAASAATVEMASQTHEAPTKKSVDEYRKLLLQEYWEHNNYGTIIVGGFSLTNDPQVTADGTHWRCSEKSQNAIVFISDESHEIVSITIDQLKEYFHKMFMNS